MRPSYATNTSAEGSSVPRGTKDRKLGKPVVDVMVVHVAFARFSRWKPPKPVI
jgi:hypothetical protein